MQPFRFLLYCVSVVAGIVGLIDGGCPVIAYIWKYKLFPRSGVLNDDELFRNTVIFFLSLILLILVHIGHRIVGAFDISSSKKASAPKPAKNPEV